MWCLGRYANQGYGWEFDMLTQENAVRRGKMVEESLRAGKVGLLGKYLWREARQAGPGLEKQKCVSVCGLVSLWGLTSAWDLENANTFGEKAAFVGKKRARAFSQVKDVFWEQIFLKTEKPNPFKKKKKSWIVEYCQIIFFIFLKMWWMNTDTETHTASRRS